MQTVIVKSVPPSFTVAGSGSGTQSFTQTVTFPIPIGNWTGANWNIASIVSASVNGLHWDVHVLTPTDLYLITYLGFNTPQAEGGGPFAVSTNQLADINAVAVTGGTLSVTYKDIVLAMAGFTFSDGVTLFTLTLTGAPTSSGNPDICPT